MKDEKKKSFFKKIFGQKAPCCSVELEEIDSNDEKSSASKDSTENCCCCSQADSDEKKVKGSKE
jgi:hypothetical protein